MTNQRIQAPEIHEDHPLYSNLNSINEQMGFDLNDAKLMAYVPDIAKAFAMLTHETIHKGRLEISLKRMMGLISSLSAGCRYCASHTSYTATKYGVDKSKLNAIWEFEQSDLFTLKERAALRLALQSGMMPNQVDAKTILDLQLYYSDTEIVELVSVLSLYGYLNRFNQTLNTEVEAETEEVFNSLNLETHGK